MKENKQLYAIYLYVAFIVTGLFLIIIFPKGTIELFINKHHHPVLDHFFLFSTWLGDGIIYAVIAIVFLFIRYFYLLLTIGVVILQTLLVHVFKRMIFAGLPRPKAFFEGHDGIYFIEGLKVHSFNSFPSGHTATAFAVAVLLSLIFQNRWISVILFILAILVAASRVYLMQHFFIDIYFGSIVGVLSTLSVYWYFEKFNTSIKNRPFWNKSLINNNLHS